MPHPALVQALTRLKQLVEPACLRLAENLELDFPCLTSTHRLAGNHGNNVVESLALRYSQKIVGAASTDVDVWLKELNRASFGLDASADAPHFLQTDNGTNRCADDHKPLVGVRYLSARAFRYYFVNNANFSAPAETIRAELDVFFDTLPMKETLPEGWLGLEFSAARTRGMLPRPIWITPWEGAPHRMQNRRDEDHRAREIVRKMGLPGYDTQQKRLDQVGLIAVHFAIGERDLYKPTVLDAIDSLFFFPAPTEQFHGNTHCLVDDLTALKPSMAGKGPKEYIAEPFPVPVKLPDVPAEGDPSGVKVERIGYFR